MNAARTLGHSTGEQAKILIVTDTWEPQVNGVVRTLRSLVACLREMNYQVALITPDEFFSIPHPAYPDIRLALNTWPGLGRKIGASRPDYIFIATEGPLGMAARRHCIRRKLHFTTAFTTHYPKYMRQRLGVPESWTFRWLRWFHSQGDGVLVAAPSMRRELASRGFRNVRAWSRGVDTELFRPYGEDIFTGLERPVWLYVGRVAEEKNVDDFLCMGIRGTKVVVGDGPALARLRRKYPEAVFMGEKHGEELARHYSSSDVFVFPSKTDTFGLVMLEALACGTPVAAYPVTGPVDVITSNEVGVLHTDLEMAAETAMSLSNDDCREYALGYTWESCARTLACHMVPNRWY